MDGRGPYVVPRVQVVIPIVIGALRTNHLFFDCFECYTVCGVRGCGRIGEVKIFVPQRLEIALKMIVGSFILSHVEGSVHDLLYGTVNHAAESHRGCSIVGKGHADLLVAVVDGNKICAERRRIGIDNSFLEDAVLCIEENGFAYIRSGGVTIQCFDITAVSYTHLRAHETVLDLVCRLLLEKKQKNKT